jgi:hypothetical protein
MRDPALCRPGAARAEAAGHMDRSRFGRYRDLGHTIQVALRRVYAWSGIRPAPKRARPVPSLERD